MMLIVPLQAVPSQTVAITLTNQVCQINLYQKFFGLFMDLYVNDTLIIGGVFCENLNRIVRSVYLNFIGDFVFIDNQGSTRPEYQGLGTRYSLAYLSAADLAAAGLAA